MRKDWNMKRMKLKEHYRCHNKLIILGIVLVIVFSSFAFNTFSKYVSQSSGNVQVQIAKWQIEVNGELLNSSTTSLSTTAPLYNAADDISTTIDAGDVCYMDIAIDPTGTEVAIEYTISFDLADNLTAPNSTLPAGTEIIKYEKYGASVLPANYIDGADNIDDTEYDITDNVTLTNNEALDSTDTKIYRVYFRLPEYINVTIGDTYTVIPSIEVKQTI